MAALNSDRDLTLANVQTTTAIKALAVEPPQPTKPPLVYVAPSNFLLQSPVREAFPLGDGGGETPPGPGETITVVMPIDMMGGVSG